MLRITTKIKNEKCNMVMNKELKKKYFLYLLKLASSSVALV